MASTIAPNTAGDSVFLTVVDMPNDRRDRAGPAHDGHGERHKRGISGQRLAIDVRLLCLGAGRHEQREADAHQHETADDANHGERNLEGPQHDVPEEEKEEQEAGGVRTGASRQLPASG